MVQELSHTPCSLPDWALLEGRDKRVSIPVPAQGLAWSRAVGKGAGRGMAGSAEWALMEPPHPMPPMPQI